MAEQYADPLPVVQHFGLKYEATPHADYYRCSVAVAVAAGLVCPDQLPGAPGMNRVAVKLLPDGSVPSGSKHASHPPGTRSRGAKSIRRSGDRLSIMVWLGGERRPEFAWPTEWPAGLLDDILQRRVAAALHTYMRTGSLPSWMPDPEAAHAIAADAISRARASAMRGA